MIELITTFKNLKDNLIYFQIQMHYIPIINLQVVMIYIQQWKFI